MPCTVDLRGAECAAAQVWRLKLLLLSHVHLSLLVLSTSTGPTHLERVAVRAPTCKEGDVCDGVPRLLPSHRAVALLDGRLEHLRHDGPQQLPVSTLRHPHPAALHHRNDTSSSGSRCAMKSGQVIASAQHTLTSTALGDSNGVGVEASEAHKRDQS